MTSAPAPSQPPGRSRLPKAVLVSGAAIGVIYGYDVGASAGAMLFLPKDMHLSTSATSFINTVLSIGLLVGALLAGKLIDAVGRRGAMMLVAGSFTIFALTSALSPNLLTLDLSRLLLGAAIGISTVAAPVYIAECAPHARRGLAVAIYQLANTLGIMVAYLAGYVLAPTGSWRLMLGISAIPSLLVLAGLVKAIDTPRWYVMRGERERAAAALRILEPAVDPAAEITRLATALDQDARETRGRGSLRTIMRPPYLRAFLFVVGLGLFTKLTGISAIVYYKPLILKGMGFTGNVSLLLIPAAIQVPAALSTWFAVAKVDKLGRKPILLAGIGAMIAADALIAYTYHTGVHGTVLKSIAITGFTLFQMGFGLGFGALIWVYAAESFPGRLRATGASVTLTADLAISLVLAQYFLPVLNALGGMTTFMLFLAVSVLALLFVARLAPETKGRPLDAIQDYWENGGHWPENTDQPANAETATAMTA
jgi:sugar porter (SP) family MFS transporter